MKSPLFVKFLRPAFLVVLVALVTGCATTAPKPSPCPQKYSFHYVDSVRGFSLCLPAGLKQTVSSASTVFTGFAVPPGTNLQEKTLVVVSGSYDMLQGATPAGTLTAGGVVLQRVRADEGSAGHSTLHVIYTWKKKKGASVHFDFTHRAVNVGNFDPADRPKEYDQAAQIKLSEEIMSTFKRLP